MAETNRKKEVGKQRNTTLNLVVRPAKVGIQKLDTDPWNPVLAEMPKIGLIVFVFLKIMPTCE